MEMYSYTDEMGIVLKHGEINNGVSYPIGQTSVYGVRIQGSDQK